MYARISEESSYYVKKNYMSIKIMWNEIKKSSLLPKAGFLSQVPIPNGTTFNSYINISDKELITSSWHVLSMNYYKCSMKIHQTF